MKDIFQQSQITSELLRIVISRSEDLALLKSLSDRKTGKLRVQSFYAEKSLNEIEFKEDWRYPKEDSLLLQLFTSRCDNPAQKRQLDKTARKMSRINMQFDEDPTEKDLNLSEIHLQKVMSVRISQENTSVNYNDRGQTVISLPGLSINPSVWRENYSPVAKIIEGCLSGEVLTPYSSMYLCVRQNRNLYTSELARQKAAIEEGSVGLSPNITVCITLKKSKQCIVTQKAVLLPIKKPAQLPEPEYASALLGMMVEANAEVERGMKAFAAGYYARNGEESGRVCKNKDLVSKALRARDYEKFSAVHPWGNNSGKYRLSTVKTLKSLHMQPDVLFDLENTYFDENCNLAERIKVIHSCLIIQNTYKERRRREIERKIVVIQRFVRKLLARRKGERGRIDGLKKLFYWERLRHWYPLMVNKFRERKSVVSGKNYSIFYVKIVMIQKCIRGYLSRKNIISWKKIFSKLRERKNFENFYINKQKLWKISRKYEDAVLANPSFVQNYDSCSTSISVSTDGDYSGAVYEYNSRKAKEEVDMRKQYLMLAKIDRIQNIN